MPWSKVQYPTPEQWKQFKIDFEKEHGFSFSKKIRYFVDENLGQGTTEILEEWGCNVTDVWEEALSGQPDENIWKYCQKTKRTILSHDDDFMDHRKYPLRGCWGAVVLPHKEGGESQLYEKLWHLHDYLLGGGGLIYERKVIIRENGHWEVFFQGDSGKVQSIVYDLSDINHIFEMTTD